MYVHDRLMALFFYYCFCFCFRYAEYLPSRCYHCFVLIVYIHSLSEISIVDIDGSCFVPEIIFYYCSYMFRGWSSENLTTEFNGTHYICNSTHLTTFAVLIDVTPNDEVNVVCVHINTVL